MITIFEKSSPFHPVSESCRVLKKVDNLDSEEIQTKTNKNKWNLREFYNQRNAKINLFLNIG